MYAFCAKCGAVASRSMREASVTALVAHAGYMLAERLAALKVQQAA
jgi:hypothetical protein